MPFSEDQLDQMLSGYLDDALETSDRSSLEELLQKDSLVRDRLSDMQAIRQSLKQISRTDASVKLDDAFADRVLNEAVSRARDEGLSAEHPLVRVAEQPIRSLNKRQSRWNRKAIASALAVAASIGFIAWSVAMRPAADPIQGTDGIVAQDPSGIDEMEDDGGLNDSRELGLANPEAIAAIDDKNVLEQNGLGQSTPKEMSQAINPAIDTEPSRTSIASAKVENPSVGGLGTESSGAANTNATGMSAAANGKSPMVSVGDAPPTRPAAVIVLDVRQSELGRELDSVRQALASAQLSSSDKKPVNGELAEAATSSAGVSSDQRVSLMYLEASAKKLDNFYLAMLQDNEGIDSVSLSLATDAPMMDSIEDLRPEAETVSADNGVVHLSGEKQLVDNLVNQVDQLQFIPLNRDMAAGMSQSDESSTSAAILVIIR